MCELYSSLGLRAAQWSSAIVALQPGGAMVFAYSPCAWVWVLSGSPVPPTVQSMDREFLLMMNDLN